MANNSDDVGIFYGRGDGTFKPAVTYRTGSGPTYRPEVLAIAGSASRQRLDLVVSAGLLSVLASGGTGHFQAARDYLMGDPTVLDFTDQVAFGDLNGDGRADMAIADQQGVAVFMNAGGGTFAPATHYGLFSAGVALADFNGDGKLDLVSGFDEISIMLGRGDGSFDHLVKYPISGRISSYAVGDFNGDRNLDIVATDNYYGFIYVLLGKGDGTFRKPVAFPSYPTPGAPSVVLVADLNGDGILDLYATGVQTPGQVFLGKGDGTFQPGFPAGDSGGLTAVLADFNGDGVLDLAVTAGGVWVALGKGDGTFLPGKFYGNFEGVCCVAAADFNGDGRTDLAVGDTGTDSIAILYGNGDGSFQDAVSFDACQIWAVGAADLNGDGAPDLAIVDPSDGYGVGTATVAVALNRHVKGSAFVAPAAPVDLLPGIGKWVGEQ